MQVVQVKKKTPWLLLLAAIGLLALAILLLVSPEAWVATLLLISTCAILVIYGAVRMLECSRKKEDLKGLFTILITWGIAAALLTLDIQKDIFALVPSIIVGAVSLILGVMRLLIMINCIANRYKGVVRNGFSAIICIAFGLMLVIQPINNFAVLALVAAIYLIIYAVTLFGDFFASIFRVDLQEDRTKRRVHHGLPNIISAVKPANMIAEINEAIADGKLTGGMLVAETDSKDVGDVNLEIMVHLTTKGANKFGHVDICLGDKIYSYGTYDSSKDKFGGFVSQGTFIIVPKIPYLKHCLNYQKKYVIGFGAALSDVQYKSVEQKIATLLEDCQPFESLYEQAVKEGKDGSDLHDPASNMVRDVGGKVYTVVTGPFRRYFGINTNCVHVADWLLSDSGIDSISFSSLRTPGAYYNMLDKMFARKNTRIIRKTAYIVADDIQ